MGEYMMKAIIHGTEELAKFVAQLVREGICFSVIPQQNDYGVTSYVVEFSGGC
jgi:hypothetical protein